MDTKRIFRGGEGGFTILELLISLTILLFVTAGVYAVYQYMQRTWVVEDIKAELQQSTRVAMDSMVRELMMTGYGAAKEEIKISKAEADKLEFKMYDAHGYNGPKTYSIYYYLTGGKLVRRSKLPTDASYNASNDRIIAENVQSLAFSYYYAAPNPTVPAPLSDFNYASDIAGKRDDIRRITVSVNVRSSRPKPNKANPPEYWYMTLRADVSLRNMYEGEMTLDTIKPAAVASLQVVDGRNCDTLIAEWPKSTEQDIVGYLIQYGTSAGSYTAYKDVPVSSLSDPDNPQTEFPVSYSPYLTNDVTYYVNIQSYDRSHNYSPLRATDISGNPFPNITSLSESGDDTTCNPRKPDPPASFTATGQERQVRLTWTAPIYDGLEGYRVYRSYTTISEADLPRDDELHDLNSGNTIIEVAHEPGGGWTGPTLDENATSFIDNDPNLVGCRTYYYAICAVGCDKTLIWGDGTDSLGRGGRYSSAQYATADAAPNDSLDPNPPTISTGSKPGWKRVFIQHTKPLTNTDGTAIKDYAYTMLFYTYNQGSTDPLADPPPDPPMPVVTKDADGNLVLGAGTYILPFIQGNLDIDKDGTVDADDKGAVSTNRTIIFNHLSDPNYSSTAPPQLPVNSKFRILAVAFDNCGNMSDTTNTVAMTLATLCGDDPAGYPTWPVCQTTVPSVWFSGSTNDLDTSNWVGTPALTSLTANWTDVDKGEANLDADGNIITCPGDPGGMIDFQGFGIRKNTTGSFSVITDNNQFDSAAGDNFPLWDPQQYYSDLMEGMAYYFDVQTTDCYFWSHAGASTNISPGSAMPAFGIKPGRLDRYKRTDTLVTNPEFNVASTSGAFHNTVRLYLQNTSLSTLQIDWMKFAWDNDVAFLKTVTIGPLTDGTQRVVTLSAGSSTLTTVNSVDFPVTNQAVSSAQPSIAIPVTLEFASSSGVVNETVDMRGVTLKMEIGFTNNSMPSSGGTGLSGFTTGAYNGANPITYLVTFGASINAVVQNRPVARTAGFEVDTADPLYVAPPPGFPEINGGSNVTVSADVTASSGETVSTVRVKYVQAELNVLDPSALEFSTLNATKSGNIYNAVIPGVISKGVWYYVEATTTEGNVTRSPERPGSYYYYTASAFDPCLETPEPPASLAGNDTLMTWEAPTLYVSGGEINESVDNVTYNVYRTLELTGGTPLQIASGIDLTSYGDTAYSLHTSISNHPVRYNVKAANSCPNESAMSNTIMVCPPGGTGCAFLANPVDIYAGQDITVSVAVCLASGNGSPNQTGSLRAVAASGRDDDFFTVVEDSDSGVATTTVPTSNTVQNPSTLFIINPGQVSDTITFTLSGSLATGATCTGTVVHAFIDPQTNIPAAPATVSVTGTGSNRNVSWSAVTKNTDNTTATYTAGTLPGDSITGYNLWTYFAGATATTPPDPNVDTTGWTAVSIALAGGQTTTLIPPTVLGVTGVGVSKGYTYFAVRALDTFGQGTFSTPVQTFR